MPIGPRSRLIWLPVLLFGLGACDGGDILSPSDAPPPSTERLISEVAAPGDLPDTEAYYRCRLLRPRASESLRRQTRRFNLERLGIAEAADRSRITYHYRRIDADGETTADLFCLIPATRQAVERLHGILGVTYYPRYNSCGSADDPCDHDGITVTVDGGDDDGDTCDPYQELDFSCDDGGGECMESTWDPDLDIITTRHASCGPGGGGGTGDGEPSGGGGDGEGDGSDEVGIDGGETFEDACRRSWPGLGWYCTSRSPTPAEGTRIASIIESLKSVCPTTASELSQKSFKAWDLRVLTQTGSPVMGHAEDGIIHLWSGEGREDGDPPINWGRTMVHELGHIKGLSHGPEMNAMVAACGFDPL